MLPQPLPARSEDRHGKCLSAAYTGVDNLEVMELAQRYKQAIFAVVTQALKRNQGFVLDHGAGTGTFANLLTARGYGVQCVEPDERLAARLRQAGLECEPNVRALRSAVFSGIYSLNVLEHIADEAAELRELHRTLRPGGKLVLFVPAFRYLFSSMDHKVGHIRRYTRGALRAKVEQACFRVLSCTYFDSLGFFAALGYRVIGNRRGDLDPKAVAFYDRWVFPVSLCGDHFLHRILGKNVFLVAERMAEG